MELAEARENYKNNKISYSYLEAVFFDYASKQEKDSFWSAPVYDRPSVVIGKTQKQMDSEWNGMMYFEKDIKFHESNVDPVNWKANEVTLDNGSKVKFQSTNKHVKGFHFNPLEMPEYVDKEIERISFELDREKMHQINGIVLKALEIKGYSFNDIESLMQFINDHCSSVKKGNSRTYYVKEVPFLKCTDPSAEVHISLTDKREINLSMDSYNYEII